MKIYNQVLIVLFIYSIPSVVSSQCQGPFNSGMQNVINLTTPMPVTVNVGGFDVVFTYTAPEMKVEGMGGVKIYSAMPGEAGRVNMSTDISALANYVTGPLLLYNTTTNYGPFGGGISGFIAVEKDGKYGWIEMQLCGVMVCNMNQYVFNVPNAGLSEIAKTGVVAGTCPSLLAPAQVPTLSQWGIIFTSLLLMIIGIRCVQSNRNVIITSTTSENE
jgi:hypothetical protein